MKVDTALLVWLFVVIVVAILIANWLEPKFAAA